VMNSGSRLVPRAQSGELALVLCLAMHPSFAA
jgi:hypothetical protein